MNILVLTSFTEKQKRELVKSALKEEFSFIKEEEVTEEDIKKADIIIGNPPVDLIKVAPKLKWIQLRSAGMEAYMNLPSHIKVTNSSGAYGLAVSEHLLGMLLSIYKKLYLYRDNQLQENWRDEGKIKSIYGSTAIIIGLGDIGYEFAKKIKVLGGYTIGINRKNLEPKQYVDEIYSLSEIEKHIGRADIIALCLPSSRETNKLMNRELLSHIKDGAVLLNGGRGEVIDYEALYEAVLSEKLSGVCLDVTSPEPLPKGHPLWSLPRVIITPHVAGGFHLDYTLEKVAEIAINNLKDFIK